MSEEGRKRWRFACCSADLKLQHPSTPSGNVASRTMQLLSAWYTESYLVDLIGIEPMTSSMPWQRAHLNNRRHSTYEPAQPAELPPSALVATKMQPNL